MTQETVLSVCYQKLFQQQCKYFQEFSKRINKIVPSTCNKSVCLFRQANTLSQTDNGEVIPKYQTDHLSFQKHNYYCITSSFTNKKKTPKNTEHRETEITKKRSENKLYITVENANLPCQELLLSVNLQHPKLHVHA